MKKIILLLCTLTLTLWAKSIPLELLRPFSESILNEGYVSVVTKVDPTLENAQIHILSNGAMSDTISIDAKRDVYCKTITLGVGKNHLEVQLVHNGKVVKKEEVTLFYHEEIFPSEGQPPKTFAKNFFHHPNTEETCKRCHNMNDDLQKIQLQGKINVKAEGVDLTQVLTDPEESNCFDCHKQLISKKKCPCPISQSYLHPMPYGECGRL